MEEILTQESDNQLDNNFKPWLWKKGQSGNPKGRPKGKTMKEYAKELLECQTEEERQKFLDGLPKEVIWKMAEGNPHQTVDSQIEINPKPLLDALHNYSSDKKDLPAPKES